MHPSLETVLQRYPPRHRWLTDWSRGRALRFEAALHLCDLLPPQDLVTSVRAVVFRGEEILVVRDPISEHIVPGGRREPDETLLQTLKRELGEETGWRIKDPRLLGFIHYHHLTARPEGFRYPYPDFMHVVYMATATEYDAALREPDGYELGAEFRPLALVQGLRLSRQEHLLLSEAVATLAIPADPLGL
jgi:ADP-ribose pyrophosphatase YjhB (NUDIX family)